MFEIVLFFYFCWPKEVLASVLWALGFLLLWLLCFWCVGRQTCVCRRLLLREGGGEFKGRGLFLRVILGCLLLSLLSEANRVIWDFCAEVDILLF